LSSQHIKCLLLWLLISIAGVVHYSEFEFIFFVLILLLSIIIIWMHIVVEIKIFCSWIRMSVSSNSFLCLTALEYLFITNLFNSLWLYIISFFLCTGIIFAISWLILLIRYYGTTFLWSLLIIFINTCCFWWLSFKLCLLHTLSCRS
jgi:hypothetical protein